MIHAPSLDWWALAPEVVTGVAAIVVLLVGMSSAAWSRALTALLSLGALTAAFVIAAAQFDTGRVNVWVGQVDADALGCIARMLAAFAGVVAVLLAVRGRPDDDRHGEYHALILAAVCGMGLFAVAGSMVTLFVGLELFSISLYVLCALEADRASALEAGLKYLIVGGLASAVLLYGIALVYGATGTFTLHQIGDAGHRGIMLDAGMAMVVAALAFKASAAPLHWWTPDVYEGAPTSITAFMAAATKVVAFVVLARVLVVAFHQDANLWRPLVAVLATVSIVVGNFGALVQERLKRMLAYSSIAHAGYLLIGLVAWHSVGVAALVYALVVYAAMTLGAFALVVLGERRVGEALTYEHLKGTGWNGDGANASVLGMLVPVGWTIVMLSLAGIPPTGGFFSKFVLFGGAINDGYAWLALVGALGSVVSLVYYLRVPIALYLQTPDTEPALPGAAGGWDRGLVASVGCSLAVVSLLLGLAPQPLFDHACDARLSLTFGLTDTSSCAPVADVDG